MLSRLILISIIINTIPLAYSLEDRGIAKICADYEAVSDIMVPYMETAWPGVSATPAGPVPTVTFFTMAARQPISDFCSFITQLKHLSGVEQAFATADFANKLLDNQHTQKIDFLRDTYDLGAALDKFNQGGRDVTNSMSLHRRINAYLKTTDKMINGDDAKTFQTRAERERKMTQLVRSSNKITLLKAAISCPTPKIDDESKNLEFYNKEIAPLTPRIEEEEEEVSYLIAQLQKLGILISTGYEDNEEYQKQVLRAYSHGVTYQRGNPKTKSVKTHKTGEGAEIIKVTYYPYRSVVSPKIFTDFTAKYADDWYAYVASRLQTRGLFDDPMARFAQEFRDTGFECRRNKIEWNLRKSNPVFKYQEADSAKFSMEVDRRVADCKKGTVIDEKKVTNLFTHYVNELQQSLTQLKLYNAIIWSYESEFLGMNRSVTIGIVAADIGEVTQESVNCDESLNMVQTQDMKNRIDQESLDLRGMAAEEMTKKTLHAQSESAEAAKKEEDSKRSQSIRKEEEGRRKSLLEDMTKPKNDLSF